LSCDSLHGCIVTLRTVVLRLFAPLYCDSSHRCIVTLRTLALSGGNSALTCGFSLPCSPSCHKVCEDPSCGVQGSRHSSSPHGRRGLPSFL
jgi:hypothetical protein